MRMSKSQQGRRDKLLLSDKGASEAKDVLTRITCDVNNNLGIGPNIWGHLMRRYVDDPRNGIPRDSKVRNSEIGNMNKALLGEKMSWRSFLKYWRLVGQMLDFVRIEIHYKAPGKPAMTCGATLLDRRGDAPGLNTIPDLIALDDSDLAEEAAGADLEDEE